MLSLRRGHLLVVDTPTGQVSAQVSRDHVEAFNNLVKYMIKLHRDGSLDDNAFKAIIKQATANFVESEITQRIDTIIEDKMSIDRLLEAF